MKELTFTEWFSMVRKLKRWKKSEDDSKMYVKFIKKNGDEREAICLRIKPGYVVSENTRNNPNKKYSKEYMNAYDIKKEYFIKINLRKICEVKDVPDN